MKNHLLYFLLSALLVGCAAKQSVDADLAIENVHVISMNSKQIDSNRTVLIKNGKISEILPSADIQVADGIERIDGSGRYLIPGLSEMHAHIPSGDASRAYIEDVLFLYLANGITTIRGMLGDPLHLELREQAANNELVSPLIYTSGPGFGGNIESPEQARQQVRDQHEAGYNFLKIFPGLTLEEYNAIAEEAQNAGIEFSGHIPASVGLNRALKAGQGTIDHLDKYPDALVTDNANREDIENPGVIYFGMHLTPYINRKKIPEVVQATVEAGTWNVPTQALLEHVLSTKPAKEMAQRAEFQYMPDEQVQNWIDSKNSITSNDIYSEELATEYLQLRRDILKALHEAGAGILLGSDAPQIFNVPGFSAHDELRYLVEAGLTPYEALKTGTVNTAQYLGDTNNSGTIAEGKAANLVLLQENPLEDITNSETIAGVIYRGNWLSQEEIKQRLQAIAEKHN